MLQNNQIWLGTSQNGAVCLDPAMANRHGLIAGATGTGKTVSLQVLAEGFSQLGVPVFMADVKGDLAGLCKPGIMNDKIQERLTACGADGFEFSAMPVTFWDVYGQSGHPIRATITEMGPMLLSRLLGLNDTQTGVLHILFRIADDENFLLIDLKDVKAMLAYIGENASKYTLDYGNIAKASVGAIQRAIAILEDQGGDIFFGEPAFDIVDWFKQDDQGRGMVNILAADKLYLQPRMYSTFLLWLLDTLFEALPEQGDKELPKIVFFFDEAHLLFSDCSKTLADKIEQTIKLVRSKGVGVYFITQSPTDIPAPVLAQLSARVQHALRAFTPQEQRIIRAVAETFRVNPEFDTEKELTKLATGEALLSFLDQKGVPSVTEHATILPPQSSMGTISDSLRRTFISTDDIGDKYDVTIDRDSAYEMLSRRFMDAVARPVPAQDAVPVTQNPAPVMQSAPPVTPVIQTVQPSAPQQNAPIPFRVFNPATGQYEERVMQTAYPIQQVEHAQPSYYPVPQQPQYPAVPDAVPVPRKEKKAAKQEKSTAQKYLESFAKSATTSAGREVGRSLTRSLLGTLGIGSKRK